MNAQAALHLDNDIVAAFETGSLDPAQFNHRTHLAFGWHYLQRDGFPEGALHFRRHLQNYVAKVGAQSKYHETITWAYLAMIQERMAVRSFASSEELLAAHPELLDHRTGALAAHYDVAALLASPLARASFVLPRLR